MDTLVYARVFDCAPIFDLIFSSLSPRTFVRLAQTCRVIYLAAANFKSRAFNINLHLSRYFDDPLAFRSLQAKTNSLVSGSNALQFFDRTSYPEADFDLYVHPGHSFEIATFLVEAEGYRYAPRETQEPDWNAAISDQWDGTVLRVVVEEDHEYPLEGINAVWTFEKTNVRRECLKVQVIEASSCPVDAILGFHSTVVMNFISADVAYSLYPMATFEERCSLAMPPARSSPEALNKYVRRGWRFYFLPTPEHAQHPKSPPFLLQETRWVGDKHTWMLPLDQTGVQPRPPLSRASAPLTFDPSILNGWMLRVPKGVEINGYECHSNPLQSTVFRYNYNIPDQDMWLALRFWATGQGKYAHEQLDKKDWVWFDADILSFSNYLRGK